MKLDLHLGPQLQRSLGSVVSNILVSKQDDANGSQLSLSSVYNIQGYPYCILNGA